MNAPTLSLSLELRQRAPESEPLRSHDFPRYEAVPTGRTVFAWRVAELITGKTMSRHRDVVTAERRARRMNHLNAKGLL